MYRTVLPYSGAPCACWGENRQVSVSIVLWLLAAVGLLVFLYWLIVVGEGTYLGRAAVRLVSTAQHHRDAQPTEPAGRLQADPLVRSSDERDFLRFRHDAAPVLGGEEAIAGFHWLAGT